MNFTQVISNFLYQAGSILRKPAAATVLGLAAWWVLPSIVPGAGVAYAQNTNATIRGQVLDSTGALVSDAQVVILNKNTGVTVFNGKTDSAGAFVAPQVIPGTYKITVSSPGLKDAVIDNLVATVAQVSSVDINMQVGVATEVVTVQARGEQLDRSTFRGLDTDCAAGGSEHSIAAACHRKPAGVHSWRGAWRRRRSALDLAALDQW